MASEARKRGSAVKARKYVVEAWEQAASDYRRIRAELLALDSDDTTDRLRAEWKRMHAVAIAAGRAAGLEVDAIQEYLHAAEALGEAVAWVREGETRDGE